MVDPAIKNQGPQRQEYNSSPANFHVLELDRPGIHIPLANLPLNGITVMEVMPDQASVHPGSRYECDPR